MMKKQGRVMAIGGISKFRCQCVLFFVALFRHRKLNWQRILFFTLVVSLLTGCLGTVWTGATLVYDRHNVYNSLSDFKLAAQAGHLLAKDNTFKQPGCLLDLAVFHGDILLAGHVPTPELRQLAVERLNGVSGYRTLYNQIAIVEQDKSVGFLDGWITAKIRSRIFADSSIAPKEFKVVTVDGIVYLMGEVREAQAEKVITIARKTNGVRRVVKLLHVLTLV